MNIKEFKCPTFKEWNGTYNRELKTTLGDYNLQIGCVIWSDDFIIYQIGIACQENPLNIYSSPLFCKSHKFYYNDSSNLIALEDWYLTVVKEANEVFKNYMLKVYCE